MTIIVLHGDNVVKSRQRLEKFIDSAKKRGWIIKRSTDDEKKTIHEIMSSRSLFGTETLLLIEKPSLIKKQDLVWLKRPSSSTGTIVIYGSSILSKTFLKSLPEGTKVEEFKLPKIIFTYLESIYPGNVKSALEMLHKVANSEPDELILYLLARHLKNLYWVKLDPSGAPLPSWQVQKLKSQTNRFSQGKLEALIRKLAELDVEIKTSKAELIPSLEYIIIKDLE